MRRATAAELKGLLLDLVALADRARSAEVPGLAMILDIAFQAAADGRLDDLADLAAGFALAELDLACGVRRG